MSDDREQRIRNRAYALWEQDGARHGRHDDHWSQATREIDEAAASVANNAAKIAPTSRAPSKPRVPSKPKADKAVEARSGATKAVPVSSKAAATKAGAKSAGRAKRKGS